MAKVLVGMTMSLDGFVRDRNGSVDGLYPDMNALQNSEALQEQLRMTGAVVMGRRSYDMGEGDFTGYEFQVPIFVLTHRAPERAAKGENERLTFTFVTDGIESAIEKARAAAGDKDVAVIGAEQHRPAVPERRTGGRARSRHPAGAARRGTPAVRAPPRRADRTGTNTHNRVPDGDRPPVPRRQVIGASSRHTVL